jgi:hypothetical protein
VRTDRTGQIRIGSEEVQMKLSIKGLALAAGVFWGGMVLLVAIANAWWGYGAAFLTLVDSLYPGYHAGTGIASIFVGTIYALLDGLVAGTILAWLYNKLS